MQRLLIAALFYCASFLVAQAQPLPALKDLPVQWLSAEKWLWQGQSIVSQRFHSQLEVVDLAQHIQQRIDSDLRIQRLASAWLLSFDKAKTHYLILLSAQSQGSQGWFSSLSLHANTINPPAVFNNLYEHSWQLQSEQSTSLYFMLNLTDSIQKSHTKLLARLQQQGWKNTQNCQISQWCKWQKASQQIIWWADKHRTRWHVLWWPQGLGEQP